MSLCLLFPATSTTCKHGGHPNEDVECVGVDTQASRTQEITITAVEHTENYLAFQPIIFHFQNLHELSLHNSAMTVLSALYVKEQLYFVLPPLPGRAIYRNPDRQYTALIQEFLILY